MSNDDLINRRLASAIEDLNASLEPKRELPLAARSPELTEAQMDQVRHRILTDPNSPFRRAQEAKDAWLAKNHKPRARRS